MPCSFYHCYYCLLLRSFIHYTTSSEPCGLLHNNNLIKRSPPSNYGRLLQTLKHKPWIIYDVAGKHAWMMPLVSLLHQMILATPTLEGQNPPPCATIIVDGSGSLDALTRNVDHVVWQVGDNKTVPWDTVFDLVDQLYKTKLLST